MTKPSTKINSSLVGPMDHSLLLNHMREVDGKDPSPELLLVGVAATVTNEAVVRLSDVMSFCYVLMPCLGVMVLAGAPTSVVLIALLTVLSVLAIRACIAVAWIVRLYRLTRKASDADRDRAARAAASVWTDVDPRVHALTFVTVEMAAPYGTLTCVRPLGSGRVTFDVSLLNTIATDGRLDVPHASLPAINSAYARHASPYVYMTSHRRSHWRSPLVETPTFDVHVDGRVVVSTTALPAALYRLGMEASKRMVAGLQAECAHDPVAVSAGEAVLKGLEHAA